MSRLHDHKIGKIKEQERIAKLKKEQSSIDEMISKHEKKTGRRR